MKTNKLKLMLVLGTLAFGFTSCDEEEDMVKDQGMVMVIHASPDAPGVDLLVDNIKVNSSALTFPSNTGYLAVDAGARNFKVNVSGTSTTVINATPTIMKDKNYSVFAVDSVSKISAVLVEDDLSSPASGKSHIRFIHLSPNAPAVDIALDGGAVVFGDYAFKEASAFTPLTSGTYDLEVRVAGTTTVALDLDPITVEAGKIYTVFAKGFLGGSGSQALGAEIIVNK